MRYLLDTCAVIYWLCDRQQFSNPARLALLSGKPLFISDVSRIELVMLKRKGIANYPTDIRTSLNALCLSNNVYRLPINEEHIYTSEYLPMHHRDPMDRLLIAQAIQDNMAILSSDRVFADYAPDGLQLVW